MKTSNFIIPIIFLIFSCKNNGNTAREPISHERQKVDMQSVNQNRDLNRREETYIKKMIASDSLHEYKDSGHGFWFYYIKKNKQSNQKPEAGDQVTLQYEIRDLSDNIIYPITPQKTYKVDRENYFRGFREAIKLMKENEEAVFLFPSNAAYGYHGDEKKIGSNIPLKVDIKIIKIEKNKE